MCLCPSLLTPKNVLVQIGGSAKCHFEDQDEQQQKREEQRREHTQKNRTIVKTHVIYWPTFTT